MYEFDSFFTLTLWERVGLVAVSLGFALVCLAVVWAVSRRVPWPLGVVCAGVVFAGFVWLSPQGYYAYYRLIFEDLPAQWVIRESPSLGELWGHLSFTGRATLSSHTKGVLGWALLSVVFLRRRSNCRDAAN